MYTFLRKHKKHSMLGAVGLVTVLQSQAMHCILQP